MLCRGPRWFRGLAPADGRVPRFRVGLLGAPHSRVVARVLGGGTPECGLRPHLGEIALAPTTHAIYYTSRMGPLGMGPHRQAALSRPLSATPRDGFVTPPLKWDRKVAQVHAMTLAKAVATKFRALAATGR